MTPLLQRQVKKFLPKEFQSNPALDVFLNALDSSYKMS
jgi:hypothetical protein